MKKIILSSLAILILITAQAQRDKEFQIRAGFGWSIYSTTTELSATVNGFTFSNTHDDNAATVQLPFEFRYELTRRLNVGLDIKLGSYLYDPDSTEGKTNHFATVGVAAEYNLINGDNFRWYTGAGINTCVLNLKSESQVPGASIAYETKYKGGGFRVNTGILWFFAGHLGLNINLGFDSHDFTLDTYEINGESQDLSNVKGTLTIKGIDGTVGLVQRF